MNSSYVVGFIDRLEAERILISKQEEGSFLVRFSDSEAGTVSIPFSYWDSQRGTFNVKSLPVSRGWLTCIDIRQTINQVIIQCGSYQIILGYVWHMTGVKCKEEWKSELKFIAFPVGSSNSNPSSILAPQRQGYDRLDSVLVAYQDVSSSSDVGVVNSPSPAESQFTRREFPGEGMMKQAGPFVDESSSGFGKQCTN